MLSDLTSGVGRQRVLAVVSVLVLIMASFATMGVADHSQDRDDLDQHCPNHQTEPKDDDPAPGDVNELEVDGETVWLHYSEDLHSVEFYADEDGTEPITVEFCIKAGDKAGGVEVGQEGHVSWENNGGQTPQISYVVVYEIIEDDEPREADDVDLQPETSVNPHESEHTVTATVTDTDGEPFDGAEVLFEVYRDDGDTPVESGVEIADEDGVATFTYTGPDEDADDLIFACTNPDGTAPDTCSDDGETLNADVVGDTAEKQWRPDVAAFCRARTVTLLDEALILFEANEDGTPCVTEDGSLLNEGQVRLLRAETDEDDNNSATSEVLGLGGQDGDPGGISLLGARTDCDNQEAYLLLITDGDGDELLKIAGEDDPLPNLAMDDENGIFFTDTDEEEGKAQVLALRLQGTELVVVGEAETRC